MHNSMSFTKLTFRIYTGFKHSETCYFLPRSIYRDRADHGMGTEGYRDPVSRDWTSGRGLHAQEGTETQVPV